MSKPRGRRRDGHRSPDAVVSAPSRVPATVTAERPLERLLESPHLARIVPRLSPEILHLVIRDHGLDGCGALIAAATPQQLTSVLDLDLWRTAPGRDDQFDERRFGALLETLMEEGESTAARVVASLDCELTVAGLSRYVRVFDPGVFMPAVSSDDDLDRPDAATTAHLECEAGGYLVRARTTRAWDAIVGLLVTLAAEQPECFHALMRGCRALSNSTPEPDGLDDLLLAPDQLVHDVSLDRENRRTQQGYLSAGDARAFLEMARRPGPSRPPGASSLSAIAAAYFRGLDDATASDAGDAPPAAHSEAEPSDPDVSASIDAVVELLADAGLASARPRTLLGPATRDEARLMPLQPLMEHVGHADHDAYFARNRELAFLANALVAGCSVYSRPFTAQEAWNAAAGVCNLGIEIWPAGWPDTGVDRTPAQDVTTTPETFLIDHDLITAFEAGWRLLHQDVTMFVAEQLIAALAGVHSLDAATDRDLVRLRREMERQCESATPWRARDALEVIAILDTPAWACLLGLLSECPVLPAALTAMLDHRASSVSATAFECFATNGQIRKVREFADRLRDVLIE
jgi:hypothetical protein